MLIERLLAVTAPGTKVVVKFTEFDLDSTIDPMGAATGQGPDHTSADYVRLFDGPDENAPIITRLSGQNVDASAWASQGNTMLIT